MLRATLGMAMIACAMGLPKIKDNLNDWRIAVNDARYERVCVDSNGDGKVDSCYMRWVDDTPRVSTAPMVRNYAQNVVPLANASPSHYAYPNNYAPRVVTAQYSLMSAPMASSAPGCDGTPVQVSQSPVQAGCDGTPTPAQGPPVENTVQPAVRSESSVCQCGCMEGKPCTCPPGQCPFHNAQARAQASVPMATYSAPMVVVSSSPAAPMTVGSSAMMSRWGMNAEPTAVMWNSSSTCNDPNCLNPNCPNRMMNQQMMQNGGQMMSYGNAIQTYGVGRAASAGTAWQTQRGQPMRNMMRLGVRSAWRMTGGGRRAKRRAGL